METFVLPKQLLWLTEG